MSGEDAINRVQGLPGTVESISGELAALGVTEGSILLVHSSLSSLGWVCGGPVAVIAALRHVVGSTGTLVMPAHSDDVSDPANWENPPVPRDWWALIRESMPAFDPVLTPTWDMGRIAESFLHHPGVIRSAHPQYSFAAQGPAAELITHDHRPGDGLGNPSPLGRLYEMGASVLLLGVGHGQYTSLHLGERRVLGDNCAVKTTGAPMRIDGRRQWVEFVEPELDEDDFSEIGDAFSAATGLVKCGKIGEAEARLMPQRELVDFGAEWIAAHRGTQDGDGGQNAESPPPLKLILSDDPETFLAWTRKIENLLDGRWTRQLEGLDQSYWDLEVDGIVLTVHREHYLGVSVSCVSVAGGEDLIRRIESELLT